MATLAIAGPVGGVVDEPTTSHGMWAAAAATVTAFVSIVIAWIRGRSEHRLKQTEVSTEWQRQMLTRIGNLENEDRAKQERLDAVEEQNAQCQLDYAELSGRYAGLEAAKNLLAGELDDMRAENVRLRDRLARSETREAALGRELRELHSALATRRDTPKPPETA